MKILGPSSIYVYCVVSTVQQYSSLYTAFMTVQTATGKTARPANIMFLYPKYADVGDP